MPTLVFLIALAQMGIPTALSKIIAQSQNPMNGIYSSFLLSLVNNLTLIVIFVFLIPVLSKKMFHDDNIAIILKAMILMIPLVTLSGLTKAILQGQQHHFIACFSQIIEELFRLGYLISYFSKGINESITAASIAMKSIFVGECGSALFMLIFIFIKKHPLKKRQHDVRIKHFKEILSNSIPMTSARLFGSFTYFLEPLIFLMFSNSDAFKSAYGNFNGYVMPLLTMPSFISVTLASALLPTFVYEKKHNHLDKAKKIFYLTAWICIFISFCCAMITFLFPAVILQAFYHTNQGIDQLRLTSLPFIFYSLQPVFSSMLHALDLTKQAFIDTMLGCLLRLFILFVFTPVFHENTLILAVTLSMLLTTFMHGNRVFKSLKVLHLNA